MRPVAFALFLALAAASAAAAGLTGTKIGGLDYVRLDEGAAAMGLKMERVSPQSILLKDGSQPVARLVDHSREIDLKGLRVFLGDPVVEKSGNFFLSRLDFEFRLVPRLRPSLSGPPPNVPRIIAIDPGHGGTDDGSGNRALGTTEKANTLDVSLRLRKLLVAAGYTVVLTRDSDVDLSKPLRSEIANLAKADLFVSVHFNSLFPNTKTTGAEVMCFPPRTQRSADSWSPGKKDDAQSQDAPINAFNAWNSVLAGALHRRILEAMQDGDRGEKFEHLGVLRGLKCPGVLVEPAIISSDKEGALLQSPEFREKIAESVFEGIQDYAVQVRALHPAEITPQAPAAAPAGPTSGAPATAPRFQPKRPTGP
ncbi:MAG TPA: N-acetylmuramoyl-L-alanine amidase [Opitutaceae bacterium]